MAASFTPREVPILSIGKKNTSGGALAKGTIVKLKAADDEIEAASGVTDELYGVTRHQADDGEWVEILVYGVAIVVAGGTIARGNRLTTDASGNAVAAAPATGVNNSILGLANRAAASTELFEVVLAGPGTIMQGA
jgi:hypothetical protein